MRGYGILLILGLVLVFIAFQARTGLLRRADPGPPANKYTRELMEEQRLPEEDLALIKRRYPDAIVTPSGLRYIVRRLGAGDPPSTGAEVSVRYAGWVLATGAKFDSSDEHGGAAHFRVGTGAALKGWDEAVAAMRRGEKRTLVVPWWLAEGVQARGPIPFRATLVFDVELLDVH